MHTTNATLLSTVSVAQRKLLRYRLDVSSAEIYITIVIMEMEGMAGNCIEWPGSVLRLVTCALSKDQCTSCSVRWRKYNILSLLFILIAYK